ncbi:hypothetical protein HK096_006831, partial [Nowakowskiella sp. JEL0078]
MGTNFLPLLKHCMDLYYAKIWSGQTCTSLLFPLVCVDTLGATWLLTSELGCASVIALLTTILVGIHTAISIFFLLCSCNSKHESLLAIAEDGCCGASAVILSLAAYDSDVVAHRGKAVRWRRFCRMVTAAFQVTIVVATCISIRIVTGESAFDQQRTS